MTRHVTGKVCKQGYAVPLLIHHQARVRNWISEVSASSNDAGELYTILLKIQFIFVGLYLREEQRNAKLNVIIC